MFSNWIDLAVALYLSIHFINGARKGFLFILVNMVSFIASLLLAFWTYSYSADLIAANFVLDKVYANIIGFFANIFIAKIAISTIVYSLMPKALLAVNNSILSRIIGGFVSLLYGAMVVFLIFSITFSFSLPYFISNYFNSSAVGDFVAKDPLKLNNNFKNIFGEVLKTTINKLDFLTVETENNEKIELDFQVSDLKVDEKAELDMLEMVNNERKSRGFGELIMDEKIREVARNYGKNMFEKGYFSHMDLEGKGVLDRMRKGGVDFSMSGENLALAEDLLSAHDGLMKSPGHKKNILFPFFRRVGIGAIDGGPHGMIFVQNFAD